MFVFGEGVVVVGDEFDVVGLLSEFGYFLAEFLYVGYGDSLNGRLGVD